MDSLTTDGSTTATSQQQQQPPLSSFLSMFKKQSSLPSLNSASVPSSSSSNPAQALPPLHRPSSVGFSDSAASFAAAAAAKKNRNDAAAAAERSASPTSQQQQQSSSTLDTFLPPPVPHPYTMLGYLKKLKSGESKLSGFLQRSKFNRRFFTICEADEEVIEQNNGRLVYELKYWKTKEEYEQHPQADPGFVLDLSLVTGCDRGTGLGPFTPDAFTFYIETAQRTYVLTAGSEDDMNWWIDGVRYFTWMTRQNVASKSGPGYRSDATVSNTTNANKSSTSNTKPGVLIGTSSRNPFLEASPTSVHDTASDFDYSPISSPVKEKDSEQLIRQAKKVLDQHATSPISPLLGMDGDDEEEEEEEDENNERERVTVALQEYQDKNPFAEHKSPSSFAPKPFFPPHPSTSTKELSRIEEMIEEKYPDSYRSNASSASSHRSNQSSKEKKQKEDAIIKEVVVSPRNSNKNSTTAASATPAASVPLYASLSRPVPGELSAPMRFDNPDIETARSRGATGSTAGSNASTARSKAEAAKENDGSLSARSNRSNRSNKDSSRSEAKSDEKRNTAQEEKAESPQSQRSEIHTERDMMIPTDRSSHQQQQYTHSDAHIGLSDPIKLREDTARSMNASATSTARSNPPASTREQQPSEDPFHHHHHHHQRYPSLPSSSTLLLNDASAPPQTYRSGVNLTLEKHERMLPPVIVSPRVKPQQAEEGQNQQHQQTSPQRVQQTIDASAPPQTQRDGIYPPVASSLLSVPSTSSLLSSSRKRGASLDSNQSDDDPFAVHHKHSPQQRLKQVPHPVATHASSSLPPSSLHQLEAIPSPLPIVEDKFLAHSSDDGDVDEDEASSESSEDEDERSFRVMNAANSGMKSARGAATAGGSETQRSHDSNPFEVHSSGSQLTSRSSTATASAKPNSARRAAVPATTTTIDSDADEERLIQSTLASNSHPASPKLATLPDKSKSSTQSSHSHDHLLNLSLSAGDESILNGSIMLADESVLEEDLMRKRQDEKRNRTKVEIPMLRGTAAMRGNNNLPLTSLQHQQVVLNPIKAGAITAAPIDAVASGSKSHRHSAWAAPIAHTASSPSQHLQYQQPQQPLPLATLQIKFDSQGDQPPILLKLGDDTTLREVRQYVDEARGKFLSPSNSSVTAAAASTTASTSTASPSLTSHEDRDMRIQLEEARRELQAMKQQREDDEKLIQSLRLSLTSKDRDLQSLLASRRGLIAESSQQVESFNRLYTSAQEEIQQWMRLTESMQQQIQEMRQRGIEPR